MFAVDTFSEKEGSRLPEYYNKTWAVLEKINNCSSNPKCVSFHIFLTLKLVNYSLSHFKTVIYCLVLTPTLVGKHDGSECRSEVLGRGSSYAICSLCHRGQPLNLSVPVCPSVNIGIRIVPIPKG